MKWGFAVASDRPAPGAPNLAVVNQATFPVTGRVFQREAISLPDFSPRKRRLEFHHSKTNLVSILGAAFVLLQTR